MAGVSGTLQDTHRLILDWFERNKEITNRDGFAMPNLQMKLREDDNVDLPYDVVYRHTSMLVKNEYLLWEKPSPAKVSAIRRTEKPIPPRSKNAGATKRRGQLEARVSALEESVAVIEKILRRDLGVEF